ncbi:hypothetical protein M514_20787 [Trichuris suis]|uniref:DUF7041 domain-containing protein n=1 Tax=Trichuris suis TaxID=68888 RepID=A0A085NBS5_9BILA|nr:hypothetical protein M514_20787 [Trichuris suis]
METPNDREVQMSAAVAVKLPPFWPHNAKVWFAQAEAQFALSRITTSPTKFYYIVASLSESVALEVEDLLGHHGNSPYEYLKQRLLDRFATTVQEHFRSLMDTSPMGAHRHTGILREMRRAAAGMIDPDGAFFRQLFQTVHEQPQA